MFASAVTSLPFSVNPSPPDNKLNLGFDNIAGMSIDATVKALEQAGVFRTLAEPTLTAISGEQESFLAGGEFPVPVGSGDSGLEIEFKPFGVALAFRATTGPGRRVRLHGQQS